MIKARRRRGQIDRDLSFGEYLLTVEEAAERLKISRATIFKLFNHGLKRVKLSNGLTRVNPHDLVEYVYRMTINPKPKS